MSFSDLLSGEETLSKRFTVKKIENDLRQKLAVQLSRCHLSIVTSFRNTILSHLLEPHLNVNMAIHSAKGKLIGVIGDEVFKSLCVQK